MIKMGTGTGSEVLEVLRRERDLAETLVDTTQAIVLLLDNAGRIVRFNRYLADLAGHRLGEVRGQNWFETFIAPADRERVRTVFDNALSGGHTRGNVNAIVTADGRRRDIEWSDSTLVDDAGNVTGLLATGVDITERLRLERQLVRSNDSLRRAERMAGLGSWMWDLERDTFVMSDNWCRIHGTTRRRMTLAELRPFAHPDDLPAIERAFERAIVDGLAYEIVHRIVRGDDGAVRVVSAYGDVERENGVTVRIFGAAQDITERHDLQHRLQHMATHDALTGVLSRGHLVELLGAEKNRADRFHQPFSVLLMDVDKYKSVNDRWGHGIGDRVLHDLAALVQGMVRKTDPFGRWGGDEFLVLLPGTPMAGAAETAEKIRHAVEEGMVGGAPAVTISIGVAQYLVGEDADGLLEAADRALYRAKAEGRNRVAASER